MTREKDFQSSAQTIYENERASFVVYPIDRTGAIDLSRPVASYNQVLVQSVQEQDSERTQIALSSDAAKLYSFGRQHRFFNFQGTLLDTNMKGFLETNPISIWTGRSYTEWASFYENFANLSTCAKNRYLVQLTYPSKRLFGAINQMSASTDAAQPNRYDLVFSFYVTHAEDVSVG